MSNPFIGEICPLPYEFSPRGWAYCNGQTLQVPQYGALYAIIGNKFGGVANQTFVLPNLFQAVVPMGSGQGPGLSPRAWCALVGMSDASVQLNANQMPNHTHGTKFALGRSASPQTNPQGNYLGTLAENVSGTMTARWIYEKTSPENVSLSSSTLLSTGGNGAHENRQPFLALNFCIALQGMFPVRN